MEPWLNYGQKIKFQRVHLQSNRIAVALIIILKNTSLRPETLIDTTNQASEKSQTFNLSMAGGCLDRANLSQVH